jgi:hypothetical protein
MNKVLRDAYGNEIDAARAAMRAGRVEVAFTHLERAHIIGQRDTPAHVRSHWLMLRLGAKSGDWREVIGQAQRIVAAAMFSRIWVPFGNTGRARAGALTPMPIAKDLQAVFALASGEGAPWP